MAEIKPTTPAEEKPEVPEVKGAPEAPVTQAEPAAAAPEAPENAQPSKRDAFRSRVSKRYPDLNMDDEDAYYDQMSKTLDEYEGYENNSRRLRESMSKSPAMQEMLLAARDQEDFDPVVWMVRQKGLDLQAVQDDPDYAQKLSDAHAQYLEKKAQGEEIERAMNENMPASVEAIRAKAEELGLNDEQTQEIVGKMYQTMDDLVHGIISPEIFTLLAKGNNFDNAVDQARAEGKAEGVSTKVDDKLRDISDKQEYTAGIQTPAKPAEPQKRPRNMFLAGDEELG